MFNLPLSALPKDPDLGEPEPELGLQAWFTREGGAAAEHQQVCLHFRFRSNLNRRNKKFNVGALHWFQCEYGSRSSI
jgi:hypothetical protein